MRIGTIAKVTVGAVGALAGAVTAVYGKRLQTASTIEKVEVLDDGYGIYKMDVTYDYSIENIVKTDFEDSQGYVDAVLAEALPFLPVHIDLPSFGCSAMQIKTNDGDWLTGRNYDFRNNTSAMLVHCKPKGGYESLAFAALDNIGANDPLKSIKNRMACLTAPFICLDGINEKGVTVSVLTLDSKPTIQLTEKPSLSTSLVMRLVLDRAATTDEAVELLSKYDMIALMGRDYHFFITDASGNSVAVEYDCETPDRTMTVTPTEVITNFFVMYGDRLDINEKNSKYGHGLDRYETILHVLLDADGSFERKTAWEALESASQLPNPEEITSNTQWSIVYDNTNRTAEVALRRNWDKKHTFALGKA